MGWYRPLGPVIHWILNGTGTETQREDTPGWRVSEKENQLSWRFGFADCADFAKAVDPWKRRLCNASLMISSKIFSLQSTVSSHTLSKLPLFVKWSLCDERKDCIVPKRRHRKHLVGFWSKWWLLDWPRDWMLLASFRNSVFLLWFPSLSRQSCTARWYTYDVNYFLARFH